MNICVYIWTFIALIDTEICDAATHIETAAEGTNAAVPSAPRRWTWASDGVKSLSVRDVTTCCKARESTGWRACRPGGGRVTQTN